MGTWEDQTIEQRAARVAPNWSLLIGLASVLVLTAGTLAATRLPSLMQAQPIGPARIGAGPMEASRTVHLAARPQVLLPQYVVVFGSFTTRAQAQAHARLIRRKGYLAGVIPSEGAFRVVSRAYGSTERALFWTTVFSDIGLDADTTADLHDLES